MSQNMLDNTDPLSLVNKILNDNRNLDFTKVQAQLKDYLQVISTKESAQNQQLDLLKNRI